MWSAMWGFGLRNYWSMPSPTLQGGEGRDGGREREGQLRRKWSKAGRKEGREAEANCRNQVGISNYSLINLCRGMHGCIMGGVDQQSPSQSFPRPHRSTFHLHQPLILLPLSLVCGFSNASLSLSPSAHAFNICTCSLSYTLWTRH